MIDYEIISDSIKFYSDKGFTRIESPWTVSKAVSGITKPKDKDFDFYLPSKNKVLVASGEQSFLYLYLKGFLPKGRFSTITPCFREESFDFLHTKYFIKNELIITDTVNEKELSKVIEDCLYFFSLYLPKNKLLYEKTEIGWDINYNYKGEHIELGSYGIRSCEYLDWIYATGVAEPRLSRIVKLDKR